MSSWGHEYYGAMGRTPPAELFTQKLIGRAATTSAQNQDTDIAAAGRLNDAYNDNLRTTGKTYLGQDDPNLINMYKQAYPMGDYAAKYAARRAADYSKGMKTSIPTSMQAKNLWESNQEEGMERMEAGPWANSKSSFDMNKVLERAMAPKTTAPDSSLLAVS